MQIKVSYKEPRELERVISLLSPEIKAYKVLNRKNGEKRKAYIELRPQQEYEKEQKELFETFGI